MANSVVADGQKIARKYLAHYLDAAFDGETPEYIRLGKDLEEMNTEMNAEVEVTQNIIGESSINISSYEVSDEVEPYYLVAGDTLSEKLLAIKNERQTLDQLKTTIVDVHIWKGSDKTSLEAYKEEVYVELSTIGGDTTGAQASFTLHRTGVITKGTFNSSTNTFTESVQS